MQEKTTAAKEEACFIHWFRRDLRLHDVPAISAALQEYRVFYPVYIFHEEDLREDKISYNRVRYILEALREIDQQLRQHGGRLRVFRGDAPSVLSNLVECWGAQCISYEEDVLWPEEEARVQELGVRVLTRPSRTLWRSRDILEANRGQPPVTYQLLCQVIELLGPPDRPEPELDLTKAVFRGEDTAGLDGIDWTPEDLGFQMECPQQKDKVYSGGEKEALRHLAARLGVEQAFLEEGLCMPNQARPDLLGPPMSMSAALAHGCLSVRKFYWELYELADSALYTPDSLMGQLLWREYFYAMCLDNPHFGSMLDNPVCLNIPWERDAVALERWREGCTGFPFIDAAMRQLRQEGWLHHVARNAVACFLTRGDLWISWEEGLKVFMKYLLDADFPVCAGNWMWVSSSAFENILQCPVCVSPVAYGRHFEPSGDYIRKFVPELSRFPTQYIYEPWRAPLAEQEAAGCVVGRDYPRPMVDHAEASARNAGRMRGVAVLQPPPQHCAPSGPAEAALFMWLPADRCLDNLVPSAH